MVEFGEDIEVLSSIHANLGSFFWSGSIIPYYERNIYCFKKVVADKNMPEYVKSWASNCIVENERALKEEKDKENYMLMKYKR